MHNQYFIVNVLEKTCQCKRITDISTRQMGTKLGGGGKILAWLGALNLYTPPPQLVLLLPSEWQGRAFPYPSEGQPFSLVHPSSSTQEKKEAGNGGGELQQWLQFAITAAKAALAVLENFLKGCGPSGYHITAVTGGGTVILGSWALGEPELATGLMAVITGSMNKGFPKIFFFVTAARWQSLVKNV